MPTITLLRHGQASFGAEDYDVLSDLGREQALHAGSVLLRRGLRDPVVTSGTLQRQRGTAELVAAKLGVDVAPSPDARFDEYDHIGMVQGHAGDAPPPSDPRSFQMVLDVALADWVRRDEPDGWRRFSTSALAAVAELADGLGSGRDAVVATSGGVIAAVCAGVLGLGPDGVVALNRVTVNASFTTLIAGRQGLNLLTFNDHAHLTGEHEHLRTYR